MVSKLEVCPECGKEVENTFKIKRDGLKELVICHKPKTVNWQMPFYSMLVGVQGKDSYMGYFDIPITIERYKHCIGEDSYDM